MRSVRVLNHLLGGWRHQLAAGELELRIEYCGGRRPANHGDPFPNVRSTAVLRNVPALQLFLERVQPVAISSSTRKTIYNILVNVLNQPRWAGRADTAWQTQLALTGIRRPEWRSLYKPPLTLRGGDLQWRILHGGRHCQRVFYQLSTRAALSDVLCVTNCFYSGVQIQQKRQNYRKFRTISRYFFPTL